MADLTGKAFQRADTQEYTRQAVQKDYRSPDKSSGMSAFGESQVWEAAEKGMGTVAKIFGVIDNNRQQAIQDDIEAQIETKFLQDDEQIQMALVDLPPTKVDAKQIMIDYHGDGFKLPNGKTLGVKPLTDYEGYEDLSFKFKRKVDKFYKTSQETTQTNLAKQLDALSSIHTLASLDRLSMSVSQESQRIMSNPKSWNEAKEMAPYLKTFLEEAGSEYDPGMRREAYKKWVINEVREGRMDIPGAGPLGARPEDVGVKVGLTKEANRKMDIALERLSERVFDAVDNTGISMEDANKIISKNMQVTLLQQFLNHANLNEPAAIDKARTSGYSYTREYDGQGGLKSIEYVLKPSTLRPYIEAYDKKDKSPKQDIVYYADVENRLKARNPNSYDVTEMRRKLERDPKITPPYLAKLISIMGGEERTQQAVDQAADGENIVHQIENILVTNPEFIEKLGARDSKGKWTPKSIDQLREEGLIPDRKDVHIEWVAPEGIDQLEGKMVTTVNTVKGSDRDGIEYMRGKGKAKIHDIYLKSEAKQQKTQREQLEALDNEQLTDQISILKMLDQYTVVGGKAIDHAKVKKLWDTDKHIRFAFANREIDFQNYASKMVKKGLEHPLFDPKLAARLVHKSPENTIALDKAISKKQVLDLQTYVNKGVGANLPYAQLANPVELLLAEMRSQPGQADVNWTKDQQFRIDLYEKAHETLAWVGMKYKEWDVPQLKAQRGLISNKVPGETIQYWRNNQFAKHIQTELDLRIVQLNDSRLGSAQLTKEIDEGTYWQNRYPGAYTGSTDTIKKNTLLKFLSSELGGKDASGMEVDYFSTQESTKRTKDQMDRLSGVAAKEADKLQQSLERQRQSLNQQIVEQPQTGSRSM